MLAGGRLVFRGTVDGLTRQAEGRVWTVVTPGPAPAGGTVVSAFPHDAGMRYRVVGPERPAPDAQPADPNLEDGYLALARAPR